MKNNITWEFQELHIGRVLLDDFFDVRVQTDWLDREQAGAEQIFEGLVHQFVEHWELFFGQFESFDDWN